MSTHNIYFCAEIRKIIRGYPSYLELCCWSKSLLYVKIPLITQFGVVPPHLPSAIQVLVSSPTKAYPVTQSNVAISS